MRVCKVCNKEKKDESFYKNKALKSGYNTTCKICSNLYQSKLRKKNIKIYETSSSLKLAGVKKTDWCSMYLFLKDLGYNIEKDIHFQFTEKYNLEYKNRPSKNTLNYTYKDCLDCSD
jgi:hypothetical protein